MRLTRTRHLVLLATHSARLEQECKPHPAERAMAMEIWGLTFEVSGRHQCGTARRTMNHNGLRRHAGRGRLERRL